MRRHGLLPLLVPVPPNLPEVLGYQGPGRYLRLSFGPVDNTLLVGDGDCTFETGNWPGFLAFYKHPAVYPTLGPLCLGQSERTVRRHLLLDCLHHRLYAAALPDITRVLVSERPPVSPPEARPEPLHRQRNRFPSGLSRHRLNEAHQEKRVATARMLAWLDAR